MQLAWRHRRKIPLNIRIALAPYASWALKRAYPRLQLGLQTPEQNQERVLELPSSQEPGINLIGYLHAESGVGEAARASLRALQQSDLPYSLIDYRLGNISRMGEVIDGRTNRALYPINLMHVNADQSKIAREYLGDKLFHGRYTIGYWYWEMPKFPDFLHFAYDQVDEIWVSTEYNRKAIAEFTDKPVSVIPPAIDVKIDKPLTRQELHLPEDAFIFLHMSDVLSIPQRKNPLGVVEAFRKAFAGTPEANVKLVIKLSNLDHQPALSEAVFAAMNEDPRIQLIHDYLDRNTLNNLLNACDCYVSLHRAEGFGLPIAEAMYLGKPVIATHWSGNADFMDEQNSLPVSYELVQLEEDFGPYKKGQLWAEPDITDAARKMTFAAFNHADCIVIGENAKKTLKQKLSPTETFKKINTRVAKIIEKTK
ncbi:Glycosyl transferases group 1 [compost metagenome]